MFKRKRKVITVFLDTKDSILLKSKDKTFHVLYYILMQMDSERYVWYADKVHKEKIMVKLDISPPTLDKHIASLKQRNLILTTDVRGRYRLNTQIFST
jgi:DNA-binding MarR family transcriptional regulator